MKEKLPSRGKIGVGILASGEGTTTAKLIKDAVEKDLSYVPTVVVSNNLDAGVLEKAAQASGKYHLPIARYCINKHMYPAQFPHEDPYTQTHEESQKIVDVMMQHRVEVVLLLGYMRKVAGPLLGTYGWKHHMPVMAAGMFNTHPGLLPQTAGMYGISLQQYVIDQGMTEAGQTLHAVSERYDDTRLAITHHTTKVGRGETADELHARVQELEKKHLALDVDAIVRWKQYHTEFT